VIGVDTGGTFTDVILLGPMNGRIVTAKTPCAPADPSRRFVAGAGAALGQREWRRGDPTGTAREESQPDPRRPRF
jgi:N-methylhydantoinase A/oxoprolinase/acetone carboxylase beta subunit